MYIRDTIHLYNFTRAEICDIMLNELCVDLLAILLMSHAPFAAHTLFYIRVQNKDYYYKMLYLETLVFIHFWLYAGPEPSVLNVPPDGGSPT